MRRRRALYSMFAIIGLCGCARRSTAQNAARSQLGTVTQQVGGTHIEILYRRPVARGRSLFGALVPWALRHTSDSTGALMGAPG